MMQIAGIEISNRAQKDRKSFHIFLNCKYILVNIWIILYIFLQIILFIQHPRKGYLFSMYWTQPLTIQKN